ncbi:hypothetical protein FF38_08929, partial [Lucilia cuprina]
SEAAYTSGVVILQCDGCSVNHLIIDNLGWFANTKGKTFDEVLAENSDSVKVIKVNENVDDVAYTLENQTITVTRRRTVKRCIQMTSEEHLHFETKMLSAMEDNIMLLPGMSSEGPPEPPSNGVEKQTPSPRHVEKVLSLNTIYQKAVEDAINSHRDSIVLGSRSCCKRGTKPTTSY